MRVVQNLQMQIGEVDISQIKLDPKSRDDIPQILKGLQHLYVNQALRAEIFELLQAQVAPKVDKRNGRPGMELWKILVCGVLRLDLNLDYDRLHELVNKHDYKRNGTTTLFAALNVLDGQVIGQCQQRHTHKEWLKFLRKIDRQTPKDKTLHLIADNYATHKHPVVQAWLEEHPRFVMHFTAVSASWMNMVERFFRDITTEQLRRGVFTSVADLVAAIDDYIAHHNKIPNPSSGRKTPRTFSRRSSRPTAA